MSLQTSLRNPRTAEEREIADLAPWFHNINLPNGLQTAPDHPLGDFPRFKWDELKGSVPDDLSNRTAIDIGCNSGFYSIELARRGASVVALDVDEHYLRQARWIASKFGLADRIEFVRGSIYDLLGKSWRFDIVWFTGVFYHLRYPILALDAAVKACRELFVFQTLTRPGGEGFHPPREVDFNQRHELANPDWPQMSLVPHRLADDPTNWWVSNDSGMTAILESAGLQIVSRPGSENWICEPCEEAPSEKATIARKEFQSVLAAFQQTVDS